MAKIRKSLKKIVKITILLGIREGYLLIRNLFGVIEHPKLTFGRIVRQRDLSQGILIFGLPGYFWFLTILLLAIVRYLLGIRGNLGWLAQTSLVLVTSVAALFTAGLLYFLYATCQKRKEGKGERHV